MATNDVAGGFLTGSILMRRKGTRMDTKGKKTTEMQIPLKTAQEVRACPDACKYLRDGMCRVSCGNMKIQCPAEWAVLR